MFIANTEFFISPLRITSKEQSRSFSFSSNTGNYFSYALATLVRDVYVQAINFEAFTMCFSTCPFINMLAEREAFRAVSFLSRISTEFRKLYHCVYRTTFTAIAIMPMENN